ncbi:hypothetical protein FBU30_000714 [Linnemannia zychae]|nr:hypothetical protein FBU30_000714 [Linnemannia zychae]
MLSSSSHFASLLDSPSASSTSTKTTSTTTSSSSSSSTLTPTVTTPSPGRHSFLGPTKLASSDHFVMSIVANQQQQPQQQQQQSVSSPSALAPQLTPPAPQSSFTPPSTRPRQLLNNVINTPPQASLSQTQLHPQPIRPSSPTSFQQTASPPPPPPPPPITTSNLNKAMPPIPIQGSSPYPPVPKDLTASPLTMASSSTLNVTSVGMSSASVSVSTPSSVPSPTTVDREGSLANLRVRCSAPPGIDQHQIYGKNFVGLTNQVLKQLDPNSTYYQRRKLLLEIKDTVEGTKTAASVSSIGPENMTTPSPGSGSPVLLRLGSGSRPIVMSPGGPAQSPYSNTQSSAFSSSGTNIPLPTELGNVRTSLDQDPQQPLSSKLHRTSTDETAGSASATPLALQPMFNQSRPSLDALDSLEDTTILDLAHHPFRPNNSPRPLSDPDLRLPSGRIPAHITIETTEFSHKIPNITPRQSSIAYSAINYRPNLNVPPQIVPRGSSRDYSAAHGLNVPQANRSMSPISPPSPDGGNHPYSHRHPEPVYIAKDGPGSSKNGPSLIERRNNLVPHIKTHLDSQNNSYYPNGQYSSYDNRTGHSKSGGPYSDATVVGGTLGFGRRASHKRNHSSADVIQYPTAQSSAQPISLPMAPPKPKSIQVTMDNENFKYVDITGIENAIVLKEKIFSRMRILAEKNKYGIFETTELGSPLLEDPSTLGPPLSDRQLMDLVLDADNKGSVKFLVTPIMPLILPPDIDVLNPKRGAVAATPQPHNHIGIHNHDRNSPFQGVTSGGFSQQDMGGYHQRERTTDSSHHIFQPDPYLPFMQPPDDLWNSVHPHQPFPDSKHPHNTGRLPQSATGNQANGSYQPQMYRYVGDPAHPHFQADDTRRPSIGNNSARTSPRFGPVINTNLTRMQKPGSNSPGIEGSPLGVKRTLPRNPNLSLVIGSNTDQDGKLVNHYARTTDRSASPGGSMGYRQPRDRIGTGHDSNSPNANYYEMNRANHPGFGDVPMVANYGSFTNSSGLPASPLSAGGKRSSYQPVAKFASSHSNLNSPRSIEGGPTPELHVMNDQEEDDESENFWGERPPLDFLLENFGRFFQDHDLDHPIIELHPPTPFNGSPMVPAQAILGASGSAHGSSGALKSHGVSPAMTDGWGSNSTMSSSQGSASPHASFAPGHRGSIVHKKSIRIVAQEAKDRFSRQYSGSKVMRRKSTKMWGSRLAEVMPTNNSNTPSVGLGMHEFDEELSPIAGSPAVVTRASIAELVKEAAQEHHIIPMEPVPQELDLLESQGSLPTLDGSPAQANLSQQQQQQQQQRVVQVESGKVMDQSRQGIYQNPQSGTIKTFQYLKGGLIGRGSFGKVYHAFNLDTCEMIAIKQVDLPQTLSERNCDRLKTSVEALFSEMEVLKDLDHENIVQYLGFAQNEETANIFLEYVSGGSIESCLKRSGPFPEAVIRSFTRQILLGLEYIHSKKIVHRDIKAANVLVDEQGICKISDFGISKRNAQSQGGYDENVGSLQGSVFWMAPEMVTSKAYGAKVDIWSFGCLVLEMFTGQQPWKGYAPQQALFTIGSSSAHPPIPETISEEGQRFLARCFITDANQRPTASELLEDPFAVPPANFNFNDYIEGKITD